MLTKIVLHNCMQFLAMFHKHLSLGQFNIAWQNGPESCDTLLVSYIVDIMTLWHHWHTTYDTMTSTTNNRLVLCNCVQYLAHILHYTCYYLDNQWLAWQNGPKSCDTFYSPFLVNFSLFICYFAQSSLLFTSLQSTDKLIDRWRIRLRKQIGEFKANLLLLLSDQGQTERSGWDA